MKGLSVLGYLTIITLIFGKVDAVVDQELNELVESSSSPNKCNEVFFRKLDQNFQAKLDKFLQLFESINTSIADVNKRISGLEVGLNSLRQDATLGVSGTNLHHCKTMTDKPFLDEVLENPVARLFTGENFTGLHEDYTFNATKYEGGCQDLSLLAERVRSVDSHGKCVRLFEDEGCDSWSLAIYPGSPHYPNGLNNLPIVRSIGPCLSNEFQHSYFKDSGKQLIEKNSTNPQVYVPDLLEVFSADKYKISWGITAPNISITDYLLGPNERIELIRALIYPQHLNMHEPSVESIPQNLNQSSKAGDVLGCGIPRSLGGPVDKNYNVFPQSVQSRDEWHKITSEIIDHFHKNPGSEENVLILLNFEYIDNQTSRPYAFNYWIAHYESSNKRSYGRVFN